MKQELKKITDLTINDLLNNDIILPSTYFDKFNYHAKELEIDLDDENLTIVTELSPAPIFYPAEEYHQNFYARNPSQGYCNFSIPPKLSKLRSKYLELLKPE